MSAFRKVFGLAPRFDELIADDAEDVVGRVRRLLRATVTAPVIGRTPGHT